MNSALTVGARQFPLVILILAGLVGPAMAVAGAGEALGAH